MHRIQIKLEIRKSHERVYKEEKSMLLVNKSIKGEINSIKITDVEVFFLIPNIFSNIIA